MTIERAIVVVEEQIKFAPLASSVVIALIVECLFGITRTIHEAEVERVTNPLM